MDLLTAAKYPFLKESAKYLKDTGVTLEQLVSGVAYERARYLGRERVMEVLEDGMIDDHPMASKVDATIELLSYPVARMIVSAVADPAFVKRYAIAEAKKADERLRREDTSFILRMADELGLDASREDGSIAVHFTDFLRFSATMRSKDWKLVNQRIVKGRILVSKYRLVRLIQALLTQKISSELPLEVNDAILDAFVTDVRDIRKALEERKAEHEMRDLGRLSIVRFPPCMKRLLSMIQAGENVPHSGRFALVAFLHTLGMDSQDILETFATAPDFDESKSRYQIDHITGEISGTEYTPPECSTMKSYGICFDPDSLCDLEWMTHPLKYYRAKGRRFASREEISRSSRRAAKQ
ncbi:MAG: DNA primase large subunit PriL [Thermoplasmata archaeon]